MLLGIEWTVKSYWEFILLFETENKSSFSGPNAPPLSPGLIYNLLNK